ncbi:hypothetical protein PNEG_00547 [Pneumocystis murina B123]|uniref:Uncharacterized protein n=1 Tax=Pneumocystis murina (strain B123) TaxID=1069680 RepID=M7NW55_PNEMU|nr:hypothetical protein PNEG_00547 [Pneumocystis murina B123]EMR11537.1 hypothetical protein PNEG_00547 [Pneumocystis murina B123]
MEEPLDSAIKCIEELLRQPDDLYKLDNLITQFSRKKSSVDAQIKAIIKDQLSIIRSGLAFLSSTQQHMYSIKDNMFKIDKLFSESRMIEKFSIIDNASKIYKNFNDVQKMTENLRNIPKELDKIDTMMKQDEEDETLRMQNFLNIHYKLVQLQNFRDQAMYQSRNAGQDVQRILERYFSRLNSISKLFENMLWILTQDILKIVRNGNHDLVIRLAKVIDTEDRLDREFSEIEKLKENNRELACRLKTIHDSPRILRNYKERFFEEIKISIDINLKEFQERFKFDYSGILENIFWIFDDLHLVNQEITNLVPLKWNIFEVFLNFYHAGIYDILKNIMYDEPDAKTILKVLEFVKKYYLKMNKELGVTRDKLIPRLLDGKESEIVDDYLRLIVKKMKEWVSNLSKKEFNSFIRREEQPEVDTDNLYGMPGAVIMFQMISQQMDVAAESNQSRVLLGVVLECSKILQQHREAWGDLLHSEVIKQIEQPNDIPGGLVEYIIALANDQIRCADYTEAISARILPWVSEKYKLEISECLSKTTDGFLDLSHKCIISLLKLICNDLKSAFLFFFTPVWYGGNHMSLIMDTYKEYLDDCRSHLNENLFGILVEDLLTEFLVLYLSCVRNKGCRFKMPNCIEQIKNDVRLAFGLFARYINPKELEYHFNVIERMLTLLSTTRTLFFQDYMAFKHDYWDLPFWYVEDLLTKRDDLDKSTVKEMLETIKREEVQTNEVHNNNITIMSKLKK